MMEALRVRGAGAQEISGLLYFSSSSAIAQWFTPVINSIVGQGNSQLLNLHAKSEQFPALSFCLLQCLGEEVMQHQEFRVTYKWTSSFCFSFYFFFFLTKNCYFGFDHLLKEMHVPT